MPTPAERPEQSKPTPTSDKQYADAQSPQFLAYWAQKRRREREEQ